MTHFSKRVSHWIFAAGMGLTVALAQAARLDAI